MKIDLEHTASMCFTALYKPDEIDYIYFLSYYALVYILRRIIEASLRGTKLGLRDRRRSLSL